MLTTLCLALALAPTNVAAEDYFPLRPGTKWVYREEGRFSFATYVDEVLEPITIAGEKATPIATSKDGKVMETVYYRSAGDTIYIVAYDPKTPLDPPRPLMKIQDRKASWEYLGLTPFFKDLVPLKLKGESTPKGKRRVLNQDVECYEVKFDAQMGRTVEDVVYSKQVALYAKGIGLVEMTLQSKVGRQTEEMKLRLLEYKPPSP